MQTENNNNIKKVMEAGMPTLKERLKLRIKEIVRKHISEMSTTGGVAGYNSKNSFGKVKNPTDGLDGYKLTGNSTTGTLAEKGEVKKDDKKEYKPIVQPVDPAKKELDVAKTSLDTAKKSLDAAEKLTKDSKKETIND